MVRLYLFAEGPTEQTFADTVLKPYLARFGVYMQGPIVVANARKRGKVYRGGGRNFAAMQDDISRFLKQESSNEVFFTTMIDLYALDVKFPGFEEAEKLRHIPYERVEALEKSWFDEVHDRRFIPFIQLHEFEAYLLAGVPRFTAFFDNADSQIAALQKIVDTVQSPELINDGQHTAPSKRIIAQFPEYEHSKKRVGPQMAERIGLEHIRSTCPHFKGWIERLEGLGTPSPLHPATRRLVPK